MLIIISSDGISLVKLSFTNEHRAARGEKGGRLRQKDTRAPLCIGPTPAWLSPARLRASRSITRTSWSNCAASRIGRPMPRKLWRSARHAAKVPGKLAMPCRSLPLSACVQLPHSSLPYPITVVYGRLETAGELAAQIRRRPHHPPRGQGPDPPTPKRGGFKGFYHTHTPTKYLYTMSRSTLIPYLIYLSENTFSPTFSPYPKFRLSEKRKRQGGRGPLALFR